MDAKPFFEFDMLKYRQSQVDELKKFSASNFDMPSILLTASDLKYGSILMREIANEFETPSDEMIKIFTARVCDGKITTGILAKFAPLVQKALKDTVREMVNQRLSLAMDTTALSGTGPNSVKAENFPQVGQDEGTHDSSGIVTTQKEIDGFLIVRAIVREVTKVDRIVMRDAKRYCAILLDNNNRKPICRLHLNSANKYIGLFDTDKNEERILIKDLDDIFDHADRLKATAVSYEKWNAEEKTRID